MVNILGGLRATLYHWRSKVRFLITMNMPARSGSAIHQIMAEHPAKSLEEFVDRLESEDFVIVEEFYKDQSSPKFAPTYYSAGMTAINQRYVGKVKLQSINHIRRDDYGSQGNL